MNKEHFKKKITKHCKDEGIALKPGHELELDLLADMFAQYHWACDQADIHGLVQTTQTGYKQVTPYHTIKKDAYATILKHGPKFGLNPADYEKINKVETKQDPLAAFKG